MDPKASSSVAWMKPVNDELSNSWVKPRQSKSPSSRWAPKDTTAKNEMSAIAFPSMQKENKWAPADAIEQESPIAFPSKTSGKNSSKGGEAPAASTTKPSMKKLQGQLEGSNVAIMMHHQDAPATENE